MISRIFGVLVVLALVALCLAGGTAMFALQSNSCRAKGGERVTTYGFNYICVGPDGRILP